MLSHLRSMFQFHLICQPMTMGLEIWVNFARFIVVGSLLCSWRRNLFGINAQFFSSRSSKSNFDLRLSAVSCSKNDKRNGIELALLSKACMSTNGFDGCPPNSFTSWSPYCQVFASIPAALNNICEA